MFPVGRLDYNTEGLLLLTNDGALAQGLMHPSHEVNKTYRVGVPGIVPQEKLDMLRIGVKRHEVNKTYRVGVPGIVPQEKLDMLRIGVKLDDGMTAPAVVMLLEYDHARNMTLFDITIHEGRNRQIRRMCDYIGFDITIHEGRNRQIRRMCDYIGFPVRNLKRIKFGTLSLKGLSKGKMRELDDAEVENLKKAALING